VPVTPLSSIATVAAVAKSFIERRPQPMCLCIDS
jgi:hypothetical protein